MHHDAGLLVQDQQCVVFIEDFKRNGFRFDVRRFGPGHHEPDGVAWFDSVAGLGDVTANGDLAVEDQSLKGRAREIRVAVGQKVVQPFGTFSR